jgi:putative Ca2+/H+ antiporter (TMEM165/GDT1 family)
MVEVGHKATLKTIFLMPKKDSMKAYMGVNLNIHAFLTCALVAGEWSASRFHRFIAT